jgi:hypothetical protein
MHIPIAIPIFKRVAAVQGTALKLVSCAHCHKDFAYFVDLEATGECHDLLLLNEEAASRQAAALAEQALTRMSQSIVLPIPCPHCGSYQDDMVRLLRSEGTSRVPLIAGLTVGALSFIPLAFSIPYLWILTVAGLIVGLALIGYADLAAAQFDPNAGDPKPRQLRGQKLAVWGEQLAELLETPSSEENGDHGNRC